MWRKTILACQRQQLRVNVTEWSRRGLACVLLHGFGDSSGVWTYLAMRLAPRFRVVAMDLRGHGDSDWDPEANYDTATFAADLTKAVAAFGFEKIVLIGHSLGADVAIRFAADNSSLVAGLAIVDFGPELDQAGIDEVLRSFAAAPRTFASQEDYAQWLLERRPMADPILLRQFAHFSLRQSASRDWEQKADSALATHSQISRLAAGDGRYRIPDLWTILARIKCPSLVMRGGGSGVFPPDVASRLFHRVRSTMRLATIGGAGHAVMMDNPAAFSAAMIDFLAGIAQ